MIADGRGRAIAFARAPGQAHELPLAPGLLGCLPAPAGPPNSSAPAAMPSLSPNLLRLEQRIMLSLASNPLSAIPASAGML